MVCATSEKVVGSVIYCDTLHLCSIVVATRELLAVESFDFHFTVSKHYDIFSVDPLSVCIQVLAS